jgi:predicted transcriptional regulator
MLLYDSISGLSEEHMMSQRSKRELLVEIQSRYLKAKKAEKQKILDEFTAATDYHRKYAVRLLKHGYPRCNSKPKRAESNLSWRSRAGAGLCYSIIVIFWHVIASYNLI